MSTTETRTDPAATAGTAGRPLRPRPAISRDIAFFFDGAARGELLIQRCKDCGTLRHPPLPSCPTCRSLSWDTVVATGRGTVFSFVVTHHPQLPAFDYPLVIAVVELEEGTRLVANIDGVAPEDVHVGMPVVARMVQMDPDLTLPVFSPDPQGHAGPAAQGVGGSARAEPGAGSTSAQAGRGSSLMDFTFDEAQDAVREAAAGVFAGSVNPDRVREVEASADRVDPALWERLAEADLLGLCLPEQFGGGGLGLIELCLMLEAQGRCVAPVPLWETIALGAIPIARFGSEALAGALLPEVAAGRCMLTAALSEVADDVARGGPGRPAVVAEPAGSQEGGGAGRGSLLLNGSVHIVPAAHVADRILVPARLGDGVVVAAVRRDAPGVRIERAETTNWQVRPHIHFDGVEVAADDLLAGGDPRRGSDVTDAMLAMAWTGLCALQVGVCEEALARTALYLNDREQFGRALSTFQGTMLRAADAAIDIEAMRVTLWQAAWRLDTGLDADRAVAVARWWSGDAGNRVVHATQHLHGGMGADVDYPIHRYFLWGKQIEMDLGGPSSQLARLGRQLVDDLRSGALVPA